MYIYDRWLVYIEIVPHKEHKRGNTKGNTI